MRTVVAFVGSPPADAPWARGATRGQVSRAKDHYSVGRRAPLVRGAAGVAERERGRGREGERVRERERVNLSL